MNIIKSKRLNTSVHLAEDGRMFIRFNDYFEDLSEGWYEYSAEHRVLEEVYNHEGDELDRQITGGAA